VLTNILRHTDYIFNCGVFLILHLKSYFKYTKLLLHYYKCVITNMLVDDIEVSIKITLEYISVHINVYINACQCIQQ